MEPHDDINVSNNGASGTKNDLIGDLKELTEHQRLILSVIKNNDRITILKMTEKIKASDKTIRRDLALLQQKGILAREGGRKDGRWVIIKR